METLVLVWSGDQKNRPHSHPGLKAEDCKAGPQSHLGSAGEAMLSSVWLPDQGKDKAYLCHLLFLKGNLTGSKGMKFSDSTTFDWNTQNQQYWIFVTS